MIIARAIPIAQADRAWRASGAAVACGFAKRIGTARGAPEEGPASGSASRCVRFQLPIQVDIVREGRFQPVCPVRSAE